MQIAQGGQARVLHLEAREAGLELDAARGDGGGALGEIGPVAHEGLGVLGGGGGGHSVIGNIAICLVVACALGFLMKLLRQPPMIGYLLAGVLIGPVGLELISNHTEIVTISEIGLILLLFMIGLEIKPSRLWSLRRDLFGLGSLQILLTGLAISGFLLALWLRPPQLAGSRN